jgi:hypothetical protein
MISSGAPIDELADDICMAGVLGGLGDHANEQDPQGRVPPALRPVGYPPGGLQVELRDGLAPPRASARIS